MPVIRWGESRLARNIGSAAEFRELLEKFASASTVC
jgi:hypothetical protein